MQYTHGGDVYGYRMAFGGREPLDFSANINPRGIPEPVRTAMHQAIEDCIHYPDPECRALRAALAARWGMPASSFFCGNGAAEVLYRLIHTLKPRAACITAPTFGEYEQALTGVGCSIQIHSLHKEEDFALTDRILEAITPELDLVLLCSPNNPTGAAVSPDLMARIIERCRKYGVWLIVDACFADFMTAPFSLEPHLGAYERLVLLHAFTKMYAVPGVRLGYCMSANTALMDSLHEAGQPWNVSVIAQACGTAALSCAGWEQETAAAIAEQRTWLSEQLRACGFRVYPSTVNYILFETTCLTLRERLLARGIMIRGCENYRGLGQGYFRVAVKNEADNRTLIRAIQEVLTDGKSDHGAGHGV